MALDDAEIKYSTVQNWFPGDKDGKGGIYNFVTKRGDCRGRNSKISWTQVETGSAITRKYPSCILRARGDFTSRARRGWRCLAFAVAPLTPQRSRRAYQPDAVGAVEARPLALDRCRLHQASTWRRPFV